LRWIKTCTHICFLMTMRPQRRALFLEVRRAVMLKTLLVHIPSERLIRPVVDGAVSLAATHAAHLDAVSIGYERATGLPFDGGAALAAVFELERERALARAEAALAVFETEARTAGISYGVKALADIPADAAAAIGASARLYDLAIVLQPEPDRATFDNTIPQEILFQSGGPVLFIPYTHKGPFEPRRIGIAWDGSRVAARALRDAAPFLSRLSRTDAITIICLNEEQVPADATSAMLAAHLGRHGLTARIERMSADRSEIQPAILSIAADTGLDLIVMGGYGHSRLQERVLGGVTRGMLQSMTVPTLMSH
jgi:nucleotide-binding universal stress UspA family protein